MSGGDDTNTSPLRQCPPGYVPVPWHANPTQFECVPARPGADAATAARTICDESLGFYWYDGRCVGAFHPGGDYGGNAASRSARNRYSPSVYDAAAPTVTPDMLTALVGAESSAGCTQREVEKDDGSSTWMTYCDDLLTPMSCDGINERVAEHLRQRLPPSPRLSVYGSCYPDKKYGTKRLRITVKLLPTWIGSKTVDEGRVWQHSGLPRLTHYDLPEPVENQTAAFRARLIRDHPEFVEGVIQSAFDYMATVSNIRVARQTASFDYTYSLVPPVREDAEGWLEGWEDGKADTWMEGDIVFPTTPPDQYELDMAIKSVKSPAKRRTSKKKRRSTRSRK